MEPNVPGPSSEHLSKRGRLPLGAALPGFQLACVGEMKEAQVKGHASCTHRGGEGSTQRLTPTGKQEGPLTLRCHVLSVFQAYWMGFKEFSATKLPQDVPGAAALGSGLTLSL